MQQNQELAYLIKLKAQLIKNELKMISSVLNEHKKKSEKEISHVNIRNMHKLFYHFFHITKNKTNTSILLLNHLFLLKIV